MKQKKLEAKRKGECAYDYDNDILTFKIKNRNYLKSMDFDDFSIDIDTEGFITGLRIFDASKIFNLTKIDLQNLKQFMFNAKTEANLIKIEIKFVCIRRNKQIIQQGQTFELHDAAKLKPMNAIATQA